MGWGAPKRYGKVSWGYYHAAENRARQSNDKWPAAPASEGLVVADLGPDSGQSRYATGA